MDNIFEFLNWIFRKKGALPIDENKIAPFMLNRWVSMANTESAKIVNFTLNRWNSINTKEGIIDDSKFLRCVLPKFTSKIPYIKKPSKTIDDNNEDDRTSASMELSKRELEIYKKTLNELQLNN